MQSGALPQFATASVDIDRNVPFGTNTASRITVTYPFDFVVLNPVMRLLNSASSAGAETTMLTSTALMRNES